MNKTVCKKLDELKKSGLWGIRASNNGVGYGGFIHAPVGEWNTCPRWTSKKTCDGGGFFMQGHEGFGFVHKGERLEFVETGVDRKTIHGDKVAAMSMKILYTGIQALDALFYVCDGKFNGSLDIGGTTLPEGFTLGDVGGSLDLSGTTLPEGFTLGNVGGWLNLSGTTLPEGFTLGNVGGWLNLSGTMLPEGFTLGDVGDWLDLGGTTLPEGFTHGRVIGMIYT